MLSRRVLVTFLLVLIPIVISAQFRERTVFRFLNLPASPKAAALGGINNALPQADISMVSINPAYGAMISDHELSLNYLNHLSDVNYAATHFSHEVKKLGITFGGLRYLGYGSLDRTDELGQDLGTFRAYDLAVDLGISRELEENLFGGLSLTYIYSALDDYSASGLAFSGGLIKVFPKQRSSIAISFHNAGSQLSTFSESGFQAFQNENEPLPFDLRIGATQRLKYLPVRLMITGHTLYQWDLDSALDSSDPDILETALRHLVFGAELEFSEHFQVRLGYDHYLHTQQKGDDQFDTAGLSAGVGIKIKQFIIDISRNSYSEVGGLTFIGLRTQF